MLPHVIGKIFADLVIIIFMVALMGIMFGMIFCQSKKGMIK